MIKIKLILKEAYSRLQVETQFLNYINISALLIQKIIDGDDNFYLIRKAVVISKNSTKLQLLTVAKKGVSEVISLIISYLKHSFLKKSRLVLKLKILHLEYNLSTLDLEYSNVFFYLLYSRRVSLADLLRSNILLVIKLIDLKKVRFDGLNLLQYLMRKSNSNTGINSYNDLFKFLILNDVFNKQSMIYFIDNLSEAYSRLLLLDKVENIYKKFKKQFDCSENLFDVDLPDSIYQKLVNYKFIDVNKVNFFYEGVVPINLCVRYGLLAKVKMLLNHPKIDVNVKDGLNYNLLYNVCNKGYWLIADLLLKRDDIDTNMLFAYYHNVLQEFCFNDSNIKVVKFLLKYPSIDINYVNGMNRTALAYACMKDDYLMVKLLLARPEIDVNILDPIDKTNDFNIKKLIKNHPSYKGIKNK